MPLKRCRKDGKPGWKWGDSGTCYPYTPGDSASEKRARKKARAQGVAIGMSEPLTSRDAVDRVYTDLVGALVATGKRPSEAKGEAKAALVEEWNSQTGGADLPDYVSRLGEPPTEGDLN